MVSRRTFLEYGSLAVAALASRPALAAQSGTGPLGRPIGLQLYTVREDAARDLGATLEQIAAIGYREVETAGFYGLPATELRRLLGSVGLSAPAAHFGMADLQNDLQAKIDYAAALGVRYFVCSFPAIPDGSLGFAPDAAGRTIANGITLDHWKWNADELNRIGALTRKAGMVMGYHNHNMEFRSYDGVVAYDRLLEWTDPALVTMELDIAWVVTAGADPVRYLERYPERIPLLHVKDVRKDARTVADELKAQTTEVGGGKVDWPSVFQAADPGHLKHYFVEQENFERPALEAVRSSYQYLRQLGATAGTGTGGRAPDWRPLFNGRNLDGWTHVGPGRFVVENGRMRTEGGMGLLWYSREKLSDVVLRVVYHTPNARQGGNSGVFVRIPEAPNEPWMPVNRGYEVQIDESDDESHRTGVLYSFTRARGTPPVREWNTMEITLDGERTKVVVNGVEVTDYCEGDPVPDKKAGHEPDRGPRAASGYIGLQNHGADDTVYFREVSVRKLRTGRSRSRCGT